VVLYFEGEDSSLVPETMLMLGKEYQYKSFTLANRQQYQQGPATDGSILDHGACLVALSVRMNCKLGAALLGHSLYVFGVIQVSDTTQQPTMS
jgi:hypothetical protein